MRRAAFFAQHPTCCFCGGNEPAVEEDHVPARCIFDGRAWPVGYNFPACALCNDITRSEENIFRFLSRMQYLDDTMNEFQRKEFADAMRSLAYQNPAAFRSMKMSANEVRQTLKQRQIARPINVALADIPVVRISAPDFVNSIPIFATKLFLALHYKHVVQIAPPETRIYTKFFTNALIDDGIIPQELTKIVGNRPPQLVRCGKDVGDQFRYLYTVATEKTCSVFLCAFRKSFMLLGYVDTNPTGEVWPDNPEIGSFVTRVFGH